jgi:predicted nucleic acid-binding protein
MTFADLPANAKLFVDANTLVYHFEPHATFGPACTALVKSIELGHLIGFSSAHVIGEVAHRLMTLEATSRFGWSSKVLQRLRHNAVAIQQLTRFEQAVLRIPQLRIQVLPMSDASMQSAVGLARQFGLLINDAVVVAVMQAQGLTNLASNDSDFDRVPGITRYAPP